MQSTKEEFKHIIPAIFRDFHLRMQSTKEEFKPIFTNSSDTSQVPMQSTKEEFKPPDTRGDYRRSVRSDAIYQRGI